MISRIFFGILLLVEISSIGIPIQNFQTKCMIIYTVGQSETVKINAKFPQIPGKGAEQYYEITTRNTQTNEQITQKSFPGVYKRELELSQNIIYEVCFHVKSNRQFGRVIIQYTAQNLFNLDHNDIKVPENLMKQGDFQGAYKGAQRLVAVTQKFKDLQNERKQSQSSTFTQTTDITKFLMYISVGEIAIILVAGIYQFVVLKMFLAEKHYV